MNFVKASCSAHWKISDQRVPFDSIGMFAMRKITLLIAVIVGASLGLLASLADGMGLKIVMMSIGAIAGAAIGGALSRAGRKKLPPSESIPGMGSFSEEQMRNYWRDKGEIYPMPGHPDPEGARGELHRVP